MKNATFFRVINNRIQFKCANCSAKRTMSVQPDIRDKNIRCHKCDAITKCVFNRRVTPRELQSGRAIMITNKGREVPVTIHDVSQNGDLGFDIPIKAAHEWTISVGEVVRFDCKWNPRLQGSSRFKVVNSHGRRVGTQRVA
jgi:DNA-directed RNA polymerase subunit RPC12/RpoP